MTKEQSITRPNDFLPIGEEATNICKWAEYVAKAPYYQKMGGVPAIVSIWLAAKELGIPPLQAINGGLWCVQGRVILSAPMMNQMIWKAGHRIEKVTHNAEICHLKGVRAGGQEWEEVYTIQDAQKSGVTTKDVWQKYPKNMLFHSCLRNLARNFFPDVIGNCDLASPEVIEMEEVEIDGDKVFEPKESNEAKAFRESLDKDKMAYIDEIASKTGKSREAIINQASKDPNSFTKSFEMYQAKNAG